MAISDNDLQVLEELLDGELPEAQTEPLRRRLSMEPELSQAVDRLRDQRLVRSRLFTLLEPTEREVDSLVANVRREVRKEELWAGRGRGIKKIAGLAAAIVLVFMAGWVSRERLQVGSAGGPKMVAQNPVPLRTDDNLVMAGAAVAPSQESGRLQFANAPGGIDLTSVPVAARVDERRQVYQIILRDPSGKLFVLQTIEPSSVQQRFNVPFNRLQLPVLPVPQPSAPSLGQGVLVGDERPPVR